MKKIIKIWFRTRIDFSFILLEQKYSLTSILRTIKGRWILVRKIETCNNFKLWVTKTSVIVISVHKIGATQNRGPKKRG